MCNITLAIKTEQLNYIFFKKEVKTSIIAIVLCSRLAVIGNLCGLS